MFLSETHVHQWSYQEAAGLLLLQGLLSWRVCQKQPDPPFAINSRDWVAPLGVESTVRGVHVGDAS
jgi:hypothetical protein